MDYDEWAEGVIKRNREKVKMWNQIVVWFGNYGETKSSVEKKGFDYRCFSRSHIESLEAIEFASDEIKSMIQYGGWDKYYVCSTPEIARELLKANPTSRHWNNREDFSLEE